MKYKVNLKKTEEGYAVWCPGLPGCWSQGETEEEALDNIKEAITDYLAVSAKRRTAVRLYGRASIPKIKVNYSNCLVLNNRPLSWH